MCECAKLTMLMHTDGACAAAPSALAAACAALCIARAMLARRVAFNYKFAAVLQH